MTLGDRECGPALMHHHRVCARAVRGPSRQQSEDLTVMKTRMNAALTPPSLRSSLVPRCDARSKAGRFRAMFAGSTFAIAGIFGAPAAALAAHSTPATTTTDTAAAAVVQQ